MNIRNNKTLLSRALALALGVGLSASAAADTYRVVVDLKPGVDVETLWAKLEANGVHVAQYLPHVNAIAVDIDPDLVPNYKELAALPEIAGYELDVMRGWDDYGDITVANERLPWGIQAVDLGGLTAKPGVKVCIIDTGYDLGHPDLQTTGVTGESEGAGPWNGSDGVGRNLHFHGTHVAGTIAALGGNGQGVVGVDANGALDLHIVRVFDKDAGFIYASDLAGAMLDCAAAGANIVSMSLGGPIESRIERQTVQKLTAQGVLVIAAAGNAGSAQFGYPASYEPVLSVAAVDKSLSHASFSQRNAAVDIAAPGVDVVSTVPRGTEFKDAFGKVIGTGDYATSSGTSMATPHVSGVAALVWSNAPGCSNTDIETALKATAIDLGTPGWDYKFGFGEVQARAAFDYLQANGCKGGRKL
ncbi:MAG TPA: S8 family peptidase [Pseudoxanthomonas sp.]|nr:S8 family peptidase [Pseudoxanthomonas sp.]